MSIIQTLSELFLPGPPPDRFNPLAQGLVAAFPFDEGSGSRVHDGSGRGGNGTITNAVWTASRRGPALYFDGAEDYVHCGTTAGAALGSANTGVTVSAWTRKDSWSGNDGLVYLGSFAGAQGASKYSGV